MNRISLVLKDCEHKKVINMKLFNLSQDSRLIGPIQTQIKEMYMADKYFTEEKLKQRGMIKEKKTILKKQFSEDFKDFNRSSSPETNRMPSPEIIRDDDY